MCRYLILYTSEVTLNTNTSGDAVADIRENALPSAATALINTALNSSKQKYDFDAPRINTNYADGKEADEIFIDGADVINYREVEVEDEGDGTDVQLTHGLNATSSGHIEITLNDIGTISVILDDFAESIIV